MRLGDPPKEKMNLMSLLQRRRSSLREWVIQNLGSERTYEALVARCDAKGYTVPSLLDWTTAFPQAPEPPQPEPKNALVALSPGEQATDNLPAPSAEQPTEQSRRRRRAQGDS